MLPEVQFLSNITEELNKVAEYIYKNINTEIPIYIYHTSDSTERYNAKYLKNILIDKYGFENVIFSNTISSLPTKITGQAVVIALTIDEPTAGNIVRHLGTSIKNLDFLAFFCPLFMAIF